MSADLVEAWSGDEQGGCIFVIGIAGFAFSGDSCVFLFALNFLYLAF